MSMRRSAPLPWRATPTQTQPPSGDETSRLSPDAGVEAYAWNYTFSKLLGDATTGDGTWDDRGFPGAGNVAWIRFSFPTPPYQLTGEQTFRVRAKASSTTGTPKIAVRVFENGTQRAALPAQNVGTSWQTFTWTWQASIVTDQSGAGVEMRLDVLDGTSGQGYFSVDAVDWIARYQSSGGGGGGGGGAWPAGWGVRPALGSHHGIGQPFSFAYNNEGQLVWQPLRDYNEWLGRPANICKVWPNSNTGGAGTWDGVAGGAGSSDTTWAGQLNEVNPNRAFDPAHWPITRPIVFALTGVPHSHSNRWTGSSWTRPGIWQEIARGDYDVYYTRLFRRIATRCGQTGRDPRTVVIRWNWEANGDWYPHSIGPDKANWITAWRRCMDLMRSAVSAVLGSGKSFMIEFGPSGHLRFGNGASERLANIYPGDDWVDICGLGIHDQIGIKTPADWDKYLRYPAPIAGTTFEGYLDWFDFGASRNKWLGTSEIESNYRARPYFPKTENMNAMWQTGFDILRRRYDGRFVYFIYLWTGNSALKQADGWGEPYRQLYRP